MLTIGTPFGNYLIIGSFGQGLNARFLRLRLEPSLISLDVFTLLHTYAFISLHDEGKVNPASTQCGGGAVIGLLYEEGCR